jgi:hypothetical protein
MALNLREAKNPHRSESIYPIHRLAYSIAMFTRDGRSAPALAELPKMPLDSRIVATVTALVNLTDAAWTKPPLILEHSFVAMGMPEDKARTFFSYLKKREARG